ncbi:MAG: hypothetical protein LBU22_12975 [Dysgonamonadaceae bacterium]|jgi:predicted nucleic acid-binding protein|nr:hypothetical protein [Dysgonamonadaceae bacterium]
MTDRIFIDRNVWLYSFLRDDCRKQLLAESLIVASALAADCRFLASEDMQDNLKIEGQLIIRNPFK